MSSKKPNQKTKITQFFKPIQKLPLTPVMERIVPKDVTPTKIDRNSTPESNKVENRRESIKAAMKTLTPTVIRILDDEPFETIEPLQEVKRKQQVIVIDDDELTISKKSKRHVESFTVSSQQVLDKLKCPEIDHAQTVKPEVKDAISVLDKPPPAVDASEIEVPVAAVPEAMVENDESQPKLVKNASPLSTDETLTEPPKKDSDSGNSDFSDLDILSDTELLQKSRVVPDSDSDLDEDILGPIKPKYTITEPAVMPVDFETLDHVNDLQKLLNKAKHFKKKTAEYSAYTTMDEEVETNVEESAENEEKVQLKAEVHSKKFEKICFLKLNGHKDIDTEDDNAEHSLKFKILLEMPLSQPESEQFLVYVVRKVVRGSQFPLYLNKLVEMYENISCEVIVSCFKEVGVPFGESLDLACLKEYCKAMESPNAENKSKVIPLEAYRIKCGLDVIAIFMKKCIVTETEFKVLLKILVAIGLEANHIYYQPIAEMLNILDKEYGIETHLQQAVETIEAFFGDLIYSNHVEKLIETLLSTKNQNYFKLMGVIGYKTFLTWKQPLLSNNSDFTDIDPSKILQYVQSSTYFSNTTKCYYDSMTLVKLLSVIMQSRVKANVQLVKKMCEKLRYFHNKVDDKLGLHIERSILKDEVLRTETVFKLITKP